MNEDSMRNFTKSIGIILFLIFNLNVYAQDQKSQFWSHVRIGGGLGLSFGEGFFSGTLAPSAVYDFNDKLSLGVGLNITYNTEKYFYKSTILGGSILGLYNVIPQLQLSVEMEQLHVSRNYEDQILLYDENYWIPALFLGAGYRQNNFTIGMKIDVLYNSSRSIYASPYIPFVRVYF